MDKEVLLSYGTLLLYLASSALKDMPPEKEKLLSFDLQRLDRLAKHHSMQGIVKLAFDGYVKAGGEAPAEWQAALLQLESAYGKAVKRLVSFSLEREALFSFFESLGMYYLPLKGIILSEYYPRLGMRQMADNDILIETKYAKKIRAFMKARGYTVYSFGKGRHDVYTKGSLTFELHRKLVENRREYKEADRFCREAAEKARREAGKDRRLSLSSEDFYIYLTLHFYKHFEYAGVGLRSLMDIYVYRFLSGISFDTQYLEKRFASLGIAQFEQSMRSLASAIFSANPADLSSVIRELSSEQSELFVFLVSSGTFGTKTGEVRRRLQKAAKGKRVTAFTKAKYLFRRIFPGMAYYRSAHPRLYKWLLPIPFLWAFRLLSAMISPRQFLNELRTLKETKDEK